jgi:hypothetical protein
VATDVGELHGTRHLVHEENALTERGDSVESGAVIVTGSRPDGTAFDAGGDVTCGNWTSDGRGRAQLGVVEPQDSKREGAWNSARPSRSCSQSDLSPARIYCFAID